MSDQNDEKMKLLYEIFSRIDEEIRDNEKIYHDKLLAEVQEETKKIKQETEKIRQETKKIKQETDKIRKEKEELALRNQEMSIELHLIKGHPLVRICDECRMTREQLLQFFQIEIKEKKKILC